MAIIRALIASVAYKEFLHIYRDRRVLLLVLTFSRRSLHCSLGMPLRTSELTGVPALLIDQDNTPRSAGVHRDHFQEQDISLENADRLISKTNRI